MKKQLCNSLYIQLHRSVLVTFVIVLCVFIMVRCINNTTDNKEDALKINYEDFAGNEKCASCHKNIFDTHMQTAHFKTAMPAIEKNIPGSFEKGSNSYAYSPDIVLSMQKRDCGLFQVAYVRGQEKKAMRFDIIIGSGVMGQSYLTWRNNKLFQLPITYFSAAAKWSNSPGFPSGKVLIDRPITSRCLECHTTFAEGISGTPSEPTDFDHYKIILGVTCEKCHGPAAKHVEFHTKNPNEKLAKFMVKIAALNRQQQMDVCTLCHGGNIEKTQPSFQFTAGKNLSDYFKVDTSFIDVANNGNIDVHGNQTGLLKASKCYKMSASLTCTTCHNTHENQRGKAEMFSQKCLSCHNKDDEKFKTPVHTKTISIEKNCIDCHMPAQPSRAIAVNIQGEEVPRASLIRSHFISIYPDTAKQVNLSNSNIELQNLKKKLNLIK